MNAADPDTSNRIHAVKGAVKRSLGWLTADRKVEAEGAVEEEKEDEPSPSEVQDAEVEIKDDYGELAPGVADKDT